MELLYQEKGVVLTHVETIMTTSISVSVGNHSPREVNDGFDESY